MTNGRDGLRLVCSHPSQVSEKKRGGVIKFMAGVWNVVKWIFSGSGGAGAIVGLVVTGYL